MTPKQIKRILIDYARSGEWEEIIPESVFDGVVAEIMSLYHGEETDDT
jgi:hypothetical protein